MLNCELDEPLSISADRVSAVSASTGTRTHMALQSVLDSVRPGATLLSVEMAVSPTGITRSYGVDRAGLVDLLLGGEILANLSRFTQLRQLHFTLLDNDAEHDSGWWTAEMVRRLPNSCHATVSVEVCLLTDGVSCGPIDALTNAHVHFQSGTNGSGTRQTSGMQMPQFP